MMGMSEREMVLVKVHGDSRGFPVAVRDEQGWHDPHGGIFTAREQSDLDAVAAGESDHVIFGLGTNYTRCIYLAVKS